MFKFLPILIFLVYMINTQVASSDISTTTAIILAPHLDDAVLPLGGFMAHSQDQKTVVTVFTGKPEDIQHTWWDFVSGFISSDKAIRGRLNENEEALRLYKNTKEINLGFLDKQYRATTTVDLQKSIQDKFVEVLNNRPLNTHIDVYFPTYFGTKITHKDHLIVHDTILKIIKSNQILNVSWYMYEDMPYTLVYYKKHKENLFDYLKQSMSDFDIISKEILLSDTDIDLKSKSVAKYTSQVKAFKFIGNPFKKVIEFAKTHCKDGACEKVYEVRLK